MITKKTLQTQYKHSTQLIAVLLLGVFALFMLNLFTKMKLSNYEGNTYLPCKAFDSQSEAQASFRKGNYGLDRNGNGIACQDL